MFDSLFSRREDEERIKREGRLPPGQALTRQFPVLHYGPVPRFDAATWDFRVFGLVEAEQRWSWEEFKKLPRKKLTMDIHCVTRWSKFDTSWEGVALQQLVDEGLVRIKPEARFVVQHCEYGFTTNLPIEVMLQENVLLATHYDGKPLDPEHGFPLRAVIGAFADHHEPKSAYFWKGGKWLRALEFLADDQPGFWEQAGYHNDADPWKEERFW
jgi:DMSO/TMAO reductase YedYZ molybdopterin-dependent catalytic subunit